MTDRDSEPYPEIQKLVESIRRLGIHLQVLPETPAEAAHAWRRLLVRIGNREYELPIDDEFGDATADAGQPLLLHLALWSCESYSEAADFGQWCNDNGFNPDDVDAQRTYFELGDVAPSILKAVGGRAQALSSWDFTMNTGVTQALRAWKSV